MTPRQAIAFVNTRGSGSGGGRHAPTYECAQIITSRRSTSGIVFTASRVGLDTTVVRVTRSTGQIVIRDRPGPLWTLGLFLLAGAVLAVLMPLGLATNSDELELWQRVASIAIGLGGGAGTLWLLAANPASRVQLDLGHRQIRIARVSLLGRSERGLAFDDIESVHMQEGADSDGDPIWRPAIRLRSREDVMLSELWSHDRPGVENSLSAVADACGVPVREVVGVG